VRAPDRHFIDGKSVCPGRNAGRGLRGRGREETSSGSEAASETGDSTSADETTAASDGSDTSTSEDASETSDSTGPEDTADTSDGSDTSGTSETETTVDTGGDSGTKTSADTATDAGSDTSTDTAGDGLQCDPATGTLALVNGTSLRARVVIVRNSFSLEFYATATACFVAGNTNDVPPYYVAEVGRAAGDPAPATGFIEEGSGLFGVVTFDSASADTISTDSRRLTDIPLGTQVDVVESFPGEAVRLYFSVTLRRICRSWAVPAKESGPP